MAQDFRKMKKGTLVEIKVKNGDMEYTTAGYFSEMREIDGEKYIILDKYKNGKNHEVSSYSCSTPCLPLIKAYKIKV